MHKNKSEVHKQSVKEKESKAYVPFGLKLFPKFTGLMDTSTWMWVG